LVIIGVKVSCPGNPGHGSRFIEGTAAEKLRSVVNRFLDFRQQEKDRLEANPELTLGDVTSINLTKIEVLTSISITG
jgi:aminoacylase